MADDKREGRIGELRAEGDAHRSLPRIAARLLATKELEEEALLEIEAIADGLADSFRWTFLIGGAVVVTFAILTIVAIAVWLAASLSGADLGYWPLVIIVPLAACAAGPLLYWRRFQYGLGPVREARKLVYSGGSKATIDTLEKLFAYLARRSSPRAYYYARNGQKRYISRQHFLGALRFLLLSEIAADRAMVLPPNGLWFSRQIMVEAEPEDIIAALKVKPRSGGRPPQYDYATILLALLEHPSIKDIELAGRGDESRIMELIHTLCDPSEEHDNDIPVPEETELRKFAKRIVAAIEKNRSQSKK